MANPVGPLEFEIRVLDELIKQSEKVKRLERAIFWLTACHFILLVAFTLQIFGK